MKNVFEKYATPISIIVAGALVGVGLIVSKVVTRSNNTQPATNETGSAVTAESLAGLPIVKKLGIKSKELTACIINQDSAAAVSNDVALGQAAGLQGTPHMVVLMKKDGKDIQFPIFGALEKSMIEQAIAEGKTPDAQQSYVTKIALQTITPDDHILGDPATTSATIIEYSDIDCPYCKKIHPTLQALVDEGKIAWVYRHSPIPALHPNAQIKAVAAECSAELGGNDAFWKYLDVLVNSK